MLKREWMRMGWCNASRAWMLMLPVGSGLASAATAASPGDHIHLGNLEIVPAVQVAGEFRSNPYYEEGGDDPLDPGVNIWAHPTVDLNFDSTDFDFSAGVDYTARKYFTKKFNNLDRFTDFGLGFDADILPMSVVGLNIEDRLRNRARAADVDVEDVTVDPVEDANVRRLSNELLAQLAFRPGDVLQIDAGGHFDVDRYRMPEGSQDAGQSNANNRVAYGPDVGVQWRFFPRTAIVADFMLEKYDWADNLVVGAGTTASAGTGEFTGLPDGTIWQANAGLRGRVTEKLLVAVLLGYGSLTTDDDSVAADGADVDASELDAVASGYGVDLQGFPDGLLANVELGYSPVDSQTVTVGFSRDFQPVYFTNYVAYSHFFGRYNGRFYDRLAVGLEGGFRLENYAGEVTRTDGHARARLDLAYRVADFLDVGSAVGWSRRTSIGDEYGEIEYDDVTVQLGVTATY